MKKVLIALALFALALPVATFAQPKAEGLYVDASTLTILNKAQNDNLPLNRIDNSKYEMSATARSYMAHSTGLAVAFKTNSHTIRAYWKTGNTKCGGSNTSPILHSGLDLYILENGKWIFAGTGAPRYNTDTHEATIVTNMVEGEKQCLLYLPMFNSVTELKIGVDSGALIEAIPSPVKHKILVTGSSITHGASACRPGATYVARMGRALNAETPNIGMSGMCKLDDYFADIACDTEADAYIFDAFSNSSAADINNRLYRFAERVTKAHPNKPIIFLQTLLRDKSHFDMAVKKRNDDQRAAAEALMVKVCEDFPNIYFVNPGLYVGNDHEGTIDGTHLNDVGVQRTLDAILPKIKKIFKQYGIN